MTWQVTTVYGLTGRTTPLSPFSMFSLWLAEAPFKERSGGGLEVIGLTIGENPKIPVSAATFLTKFSYTDTDLDPYNAERGFWWVSAPPPPTTFFSGFCLTPVRFETQSHVVWMLVKPRIKPGPADISDLRKNPVVQWQYRYYFAIALIWGFVVPTVVPGYLWRDWRGGFFYAGFFRVVVVHHVSESHHATAIRQIG